MKVMYFSSVQNEVQKGQIVNTNGEFLTHLPKYGTYMKPVSKKDILHGSYRILATKLVFYACSKNHPDKWVNLKQTIAFSQ